MACACRGGCSCLIVGTPPVLVSPDLEVSIMGTDPKGFVLPDPEGMKYFEAVGTFGVTDAEAVALSATVAVTPNQPYTVSLEWIGYFDDPSIDTKVYIRADVLGIQQPFGQRQEAGFQNHPTPASRIARITNIWQTFVVPPASPITIEILTATTVAAATATLREQKLIVETRSA